LVKNIKIDKNGGAADFSNSLVLNPLITKKIMALDAFI